MKYFYLALLFLSAAFADTLSHRKSFHTDSVHNFEYANNLHYDEQAKKSREETCPDPDLIAPCRCVHDYGNLDLNCTGAESNSQIAEAFQQYFPVKEFSSFFLDGPSTIASLDFSTNGVTFRSFDIKNGVHALESISELVFEDSADTVGSIYIEESSLTVNGFPFDSLPLYTRLGTLEISESKLDKIPHLMSSTLAYLYLERAPLIQSLDEDVFFGTPIMRRIEVVGTGISELKAQTVPITIDKYGSELYFGFNEISRVEPGTFYDASPDGIGIVTTIHLSSNRLSSLESGTFPLTAAPFGSIPGYSFWNNSISSIEPGAFYVQSEPDLDSVEMNFSFNQLTTIDEDVFGSIFQYFRTLEISFNPLECGCDIAWIVTNPSYAAKISSETTCSDGTSFSALDPDFYTTNC